MVRGGRKNLNLKPYREALHKIWMGLQRMAEYRICTRKMKKWAEMERTEKQRSRA